MSRLSVSVLCLAVCVPASLSFAAPAAARSTTCSATFHVLHDDRIGRLQMPEGLYQLRTTKLSCAEASHLFSEFLADFNGVVRSPWRYRVRGVGNGLFTATRGRTFAATRTGDSDGGATPGPVSDGGGSHGDLRCPGSFRVLNNDRVGRLRLPAGRYRITRLGSNVSCAGAARLLRIFLQRPAGDLPGQWVVLPELAEFVRGSTKDGFRLKRA